MTTEQTDARMAALREYAGLHSDKRKLEDALRRTRARLDQLAEPLIAYLVDEGVARMSVALDDGSTVTVYTQQTTRARLKDAAQDDRGVAAGALIEAGDGWGDLVRYDFNLNSVSAHVRECLANDIDLPEVLHEVFNLAPYTEIKARKG